jgi:hypothetical protein
MADLPKENISVKGNIVSRVSGITSMACDSETVAVQHAKQMTVKWEENTGPPIADG